MKLEDTAIVGAIVAFCMIIAAFAYIFICSVARDVKAGIWKFREYRKEKNRWSRNMEKVEEQYDRHYCLYCEWGRPFSGFCRYFHQNRNLAVWECLRSEENPEILGKAMQISGRGGRPFTIKVAVHKEEE